MRLWRINLKPEAKTGINAAEFCISRGLVGIGWNVKQAPVSKEDYWALGREWYNDAGWTRAVNAMLHHMQIDDLVWTRNCDGLYYLGRITGDWQYCDTSYKDAGVFNVRPCQWCKAGSVEAVPGKVQNSFRPSATLQQINDVTAAEYSRFLFNKLAGEQVFSVGTLPHSDIFSFLCPDDVEDIVGIYLQIEKGLVFYPSTCKRDTPRYEYLLVNPRTNSRAYVQVKMGSAAICVGDYERLQGEVFLFSTTETYIGTAGRTDVICLRRKEIEKFLFQHRELMPLRIQRWLEYVSYRPTSGLG